MAIRPVFMASGEPPYYQEFQAEFLWNGGFAQSQKQKNIAAMQRAFLTQFPDLKVLEISSKSVQAGGTELSAFHLQKFVPSLGRRIPVENIFQAGKVFENGGPFPDLLSVSPREAKRDECLRASGRLTAFCFEGQQFPTEPKTIFYDYIYCNALVENEKLAQIVLSYDAFTDIEFNPSKSINCQAKAAALFASLCRLGLADQIKDFQNFRQLFIEEAK